MSNRSVTIMGGGNTAFAVAANLSLQGHEVTLYELPEFAESLAPIRDSKVINLVGVAEQGAAKIHTVTTDVVEALAASDLVLLIVPAYAHRRFAEVCAPHLRQGQTVVVIPGTLGALEWSKVLREAGTTGVTLAEVDTAPYVCRKTAPDTATIWGVVTSLGMGVLPATEGERVRRMIDPLFPGMSLYPDVMAAGLSAINPVVHPAGVLMNAGRIEYSRGEFYFYEEGVSPSVAKVIMQVDAERRAIGNALGYELLPANEGFHNAGFGPQGDLWATINGSLMLTRLKAPGSLDSRWLTEDIPYGIASWSLVGKQFGVDTPLMRSFVDIGSIVIGFDGWESARTPENLGIAGMDREALKIFLETGQL
ncbi:MAG: NAD/NADP octopine/nopaline dehydrogenase family protein [Chloroflexi bacterium]|nr:NAD/NADP octopine/nopaline dehydrogenase family protein [Chloroflexota bacterium]